MPSPPLTIPRRDKLTEAASSAQKQLDKEHPGKYLVYVSRKGLTVRDRPDKSPK